MSVSKKLALVGGLALIGLLIVPIVAQPQPLPNTADANLIWAVWDAYEAGEPERYLEVLVLLYRPLTSWQRSLLVNTYDVVIVKEYEWTPAIYCYMKANTVNSIDNYYWIRKLRLNVPIAYLDSKYAYSRPMTVAQFLDWVEELRAQVDDLQAQLEEKDAKIEEMNETIAQLNEEIVTWEEEYNNLSARYSELLDQYNAIYERNQNLTALVVRLTQRVSELEDIAGNYSAVIEEKEATIEEINASLQTALEERGQLEEEKAQLEQEISNLTSTISSYEGRVSELSEDIEDWKVGTGIALIWAIAATIISLYKGELFGRTR